MKPYIERAAFYFTCGSIISILFSIAVSQTLLGLAFAALLLSNNKMRLPPIKLPRALFILGTVISWLASGHIHEGTPQIRKFFVFLILLINLWISWHNARVTGLDWVESKHMGGWVRFMCWMGWLQSALGFTWCYVIILVLLGRL